MNYLITWFYAEQKDNESFYPSVGGNTSSPAFHEIYWKCVFLFYKSAIYVGNEWGIFFTNVPNIPTDVDGINIKAFFEEQKISVITLELTNRTPKDWYGAWRNQFYLFDMLEYLSVHFQAEDNFLILDSDIIVRHQLISVFSDIEKYGIVNYNCGYGQDANINGCSIEQMKSLYEEFYGKSAESLYYAGGEFIALNGRMLKPVLKEYRYLWSQNFKKYEAKAVKLNEEAHFLSLIYYKLGVREAHGDKYIKRMWTAI